MTVAQEKSANKFTQALFIYGSAVFLFYIFPPLSAPFRGMYKVAITAGNAGKSAATTAGKIAETLAPDLLRPVQPGDRIADLQVGNRGFLPCTTGNDCAVHPITGKKQAHRGIDLGAQNGRVQYVPGEKGKVKVECFSEPNGAGNWALITPQSTASSRRFRSFHLSKCSAGTYIPGQVFGATGSTGLSTGPHYHWEQQEKDSQGNWVNVHPQYAWLYQAVTGDLPKPVFQKVK